MKNKVVLIKKMSVFLEIRIGGWELIVASLLVRGSKQNHK